MARKDKPIIEYRYYEMTNKAYAFALLGEDWIRYYGEGVEGLHYHNYLEIGACRFGTGEMVYGSQHIAYGPNDITIIPSKYPHTTNGVEHELGHWEYIFVDVDNLLKDKLKFKTDEEIELLINRFKDNAYLFHEGEQEEIRNCVLNAMELFRKQDLFYMEEVEALLMQVLIRVIRMNEQASVDLDTEKVFDTIHHPTVERAKQFIYEHYKEQIYIKDIAQECFISETHLRRLFLKTMDINISEYINLVRISHVCDYLKESNKDISTIATLCGFSSISTLNRNFLKYMGDTPSKWRKKKYNKKVCLAKYKIHSEKGWD